MVIGVTKQCRFGGERRDMVMVLVNKTGPFACSCSTLADAGARGSGVGRDAFYSTIRESHILSTIMRDQARTSSDSTAS